jgi:hypothetical protein
LALLENLSSYLSGTLNDIRSSGTVSQITDLPPGTVTPGTFDALLCQIGQALPSGPANTRPGASAPVAPRPPASVQALDLSGILDDPFSPDEKLQLHLCSLATQMCFFCQREGHQMATCPIGRRMLDNPNARRILRALLKKYDQSSSSPPTGRNPRPDGSVNATTQDPAPPADDQANDQSTDTASLGSAGSFDLLNHF